MKTKRHSEPQAKNLKPTWLEILPPVSHQDDGK